MILRATFGIAVALAVFHSLGGAVPPALLAAKADIAAAQPQARLQRLADETASEVEARFGTAETPITHARRARVVHP